MSPGLKYGLQAYNFTKIQNAFKWLSDSIVSRATKDQAFRRVLGWRTAALVSQETIEFVGM